MGGGADARKAQLREVVGSIDRERVVVGFRGLDTG
jgi:hypothetical protein